MYGYDQQLDDYEGAGMDDGVEDFYGIGPHSVPGAIQMDSNPSEEERKADNQTKAAVLRAKLIAQRQNTPLNGHSQPSTPVQSVLNEPNGQSNCSELNQPTGDVYGLEALLAEGKAAAEANIKHEKPSSVGPEDKPLNNNETSPVSKGLQAGLHNNVQRLTPEKQITVSEQPNTSTQSTDAYYAELSMWLEVTGYHDVEYRNSKLASHKERKALEKEAARIADRLEELRQAERHDVVNSASMVVRQSPTNTTRPPALPCSMAGENSTEFKPTMPTLSATGTKRAVSPDPASFEKSARRRQESISHHTPAANRAKATSASAARGGADPSPDGLERRISHSELQRPSTDEKHQSRNGENGFRDPSLERRQKYYKVNGNLGLPVASLESRRGRASYSIGHIHPRNASYGANPQYSQGGAALDLRNGGIKFFMIKSWTLENVTAAMRDGVWATQEKNARELTEAYKTNRHVILLFSVNGSKHFQGYARMASPPDASLNKPAWCARLNWESSPAFRLRWLAKTPVHFSQVGHLDNDLNRDENNRPLAVLVGRDGQEISASAGMGVVEIMDQYEEAETHKHW